MGTTLRTHRFRPEEPPERPAVQPLSRYYRQASQMGHLCMDLSNEVDIDAEHGAVIIPMEDGPLGALFAFEELVRNGKKIDNLSLEYIQRSDDYGRAWSPLGRRGLEQKLATNRTRPITLCNEGGRGETLLNSIRMLSSQMTRRDHIAATLRIQTVRFREIEAGFNAILGGARDGVQLDLGYVEDSLDHPGTETPAYPANWEVSGDPETVQKKATGMLRELLKPGGPFQDSAVRRVEGIRAAILQLVNAQTQRNQALWSLALIHEKLRGTYADRYGINPKTQGAQLTETLLVNLVKAGILKATSRKPHTLYEIGPAWTGPLAPVVQCYLDVAEPLKG